MSPSSLPTPAPTVRIARDLSGLSEGDAALFGAAEATNPEFGLSWWRLYAETVMAGSTGARFAQLRRDGVLRAVLPLNLDPALTSLGGMVGALSNFYTTLYAPVLAGDLVADELVPLAEALRSESPRASSLRFAPLDPQAPSFALLQEGFRRAGYACFDYFAHGNWYLPVRQTWADYLAERPGEVRSTIKRAAKRLAADGATIEVACSPADAEAALAGFQHVYTRSWKQPEPVPGFVPALVRACAERGWLRLGLVRLQGEAIAAQIWIVSDGRAGIYKLAYDEAFKRYAAGTVLTAHLMQRAFEEDRVREVDYMIGDDPYKQQWMTSRRERRGLLMFDQRTVAGLGGALREATARRLRRYLPHPQAGAHAA